MALNYSRLKFNSAMDAVKEKEITKNLNWLKILSLEMLAILIAFILSISVVIFFIKRIFFQNKTRFDSEVFVFLERYVNDGATSFMQFFTFFGSQHFLVPAYLSLIFFYFLVRKQKWMGLRVTAVSVTSLLLMFGLKYLFLRPRPLTPLLKAVNGFSFPSGHAFMSFSFFGLLMYIIIKEVKHPVIRTFAFFLITTIILLVGLSRIYLRVHYASDVIAGFCMGFMWLVISLGLISFLENRKSSLPAI